MGAPCFIVSNMEVMGLEGCRRRQQPKEMVRVGGWDPLCHTCPFGMEVLLLWKSYSMKIVLLLDRSI